MTPEELDKIAEILERALELEPARRKLFLDDACGENQELRREVESLVASHEQAGSSFLNASTPATRENSARTIRTGSKIGAYDIHEEIGHGGMGEVFAASRADGQYEKKVAIKLVRSGHNTDFINERFLNERQILASLDHPNISRLLDGGTTSDGVPYLVMELVEGVPIDAYCDTRKLSVTERLQLFRQVCAAVQYAHQRLVIHRDIKPGNILVTADGTPKLLDFGIAKILDAGGSAETTLMRPMTPEYASPEQIRGDSISTSTDVYSLGVVLYQLLTGRSPYRVATRTPAKLAEAITHDEPERPSTSVQRTETNRANGNSKEPTPETVSGTREATPLRLQKRLRGDLDFILLKALRKEPAQRYSSVEQFSEDIRRHLEGVPVTARKGTWSYRSGKFVRRHKASVVAAALVFVTLLAAVIVTLREARIAQSRFNDVRKLANSLIFEIHDSMLDLPGATKARKLIMQRSLEYLDSLAKESGNDPGLLRELATAYARIGVLQGNAGDANLGDTKSALASLQKAVALRESLVRLNPKNSKDQVELGTVYLDYCEFQHGTAGNTASSYELCKKSVAILDRELASSPRDFRTLAQLARGYFDLGSMEIGEGSMGSVGNVSKGVVSLQRALEMTQRALQLSPDNVALHGHEASLAAVLGDAELKLGNRPEAAAYYLHGMEILQALSAKGDNFRAMSNMAILLTKSADIYLVNGNDAEALARYRKALEIDDQLAARDPQNELAQREVSVDNAVLGHGLQQTGHPSESLSHLKFALSRLESAPSQTPLIRILEGVDHMWIGEAVEAQGKTRDALQEYKKCQELIRAVQAAGGNDVRTRVYYSTGTEHVARALVKLGDLSGALKEREESRNVLEALLKTSPDDQEALYTLSETYTGEGDVYEKLAEQSKTSEEKSANWKTASDCFQKSLDTWRKVSNPARLSTVGLEMTMPDEVSKRLAKCDREIKSRSSLMN